MILIFRKAASVKYSAKASKSVVASIIEALASAVRVKRPALTAFFMPNGSGRSRFSRLPESTESERRNVALYGAGDERCDAKAAKATIKAKAYTVPADSLGRGTNPVATASQAQSILLWIKTRLVPAAKAHKVTVASAKGHDLAVLYCEPPRS